MEWNCYSSFNQRTNPSTLLEAYHSQSLAQMYRNQLKADKECSWSLWLNGNYPTENNQQVTSADQLQADNHNSIKWIQEWTPDKFLSFNTPEHQRFCSFTQIFWTNMAHLILYAYARATCISCTVLNEKRRFPREELPPFTWSSGSEIRSSGSETEWTATVLSSVW